MNRVFLTTVEVETMRRWVAMAGAGGDFWSSFPLDPRDRTYAELRAGDDDRERVRTALATAFADGRLDHGELDERLTATSEARTLGALVPIVADLVPVRPPATRPSRSLVGVSAAELEQRALDTWRERRQSALFALVASALVVWGIWFGFRYDGFQWPWLVNALAVMNLVKVATSRETMVREEVRRLEKKQARQQKWPRGLL